MIALIFEHGVLKDEIDRSDRMEELRERFRNPEREDPKPMGCDSIFEYIGEFFERSYNLEDEDTPGRV